MSSKTCLTKLQRTAARLQSQQHKQSLCKTWLRYLCNEFTLQHNFLAVACSPNNDVQCYKHVCALVDRQMRKSKPRQRLNAFFLISAICRHSLKKHKLQDKYSASMGCCLLPQSDVQCLQQPLLCCCSWKVDTCYCRTYRTAARHFC